MHGSSKILILMSILPKDNTFSLSLPELRLPLLIMKQLFLTTHKKTHKNSKRETVLFWFQLTLLHTVASHGMAKITCSKLEDPKPIKCLWIFVKSKLMLPYEKEAVKTLNKKPLRQHHCCILRSCKLLEL